METTNTSNSNKVKEELTQYLNKIREKIKNKDDDLRIEGKLLSVAVRQQSGLLGYYDGVKAELKSVMDYYETKMKKVRGNALINVVKNSRFNYSATEREKIVDSLPDYLDVDEQYRMVKELYYQVTAIVSAFSDRNYQLSNLTKIYVAGIEGVTV